MTLANTIHNESLGLRRLRHATVRERRSHHDPLPTVASAANCGKSSNKPAVNQMQAECAAGEAVEALASRNQEDNSGLCTNEAATTPKHVVGALRLKRLEPPASPCCRMDPLRVRSRSQVFDVPAVSLHLSHSADDPRLDANAHRLRRLLVELHHKPPEATTAPRTTSVISRRAAKSSAGAARVWL